MYALSLDAIYNGCYSIVEDTQSYKKKYDTYDGGCKSFVFAMSEVVASVLRFVGDIDKDEDNDVGDEV